MKVLAKNRRVRFDYEIAEKLIAGIALEGHEVKSAKAGQISLKGSFVTLRNGEAYLTNAHVTPYKHARPTSEPTRSRKLLLHRKQLEQLAGSKQSGNNIVPLAILLERNLVKVELGVGRGRKRYDKRHLIKKRDTEREVARDLGAKR